MAGLLLEQTESTLSTLLVVHRSFSYVKVLMMLTRAWGPPLARMISYNRNSFNPRSETEQRSHCRTRLNYLALLVAVRQDLETVGSNCQELDIGVGQQGHHLLQSPSQTHCHLCTLLMQQQVVKCGDGVEQDAVHRGAEKNRKDRFHSYNKRCKTTQRSSIIIPSQGSLHMISILSVTRLRPPHYSRQEKHNAVQITKTTPPSGCLKNMAVRNSDEGTKHQPVSRSCKHFVKSWLSKDTPLTFRTNETQIYLPH